MRECKCLRRNYFCIRVCPTFQIFSSTLWHFDRRVYKRNLATEEKNYTERKMFRDSWGNTTKNRFSSIRERTSYFISRGNYLSFHSPCFANYNASRALSLIKMKPNLHTEKDSGRVVVSPRRVIVIFLATLFFSDNCTRNIDFHLSGLAKQQSMQETRAFQAAKQRFRNTFGEYGNKNQPTALYNNRTFLWAFPLYLLRRLS